jgi:hypothetical protein
VIFTVGVMAFVLVPVPTAALKILTPLTVSVMGQVTLFVGFEQPPPLQAAGTASAVAISRVEILFMVLL